MSLINNMLLELDARSDSKTLNTSNHQEMHDLSAQLQPVEPAPVEFVSRKSATILFSMICITVLIGLYVWQTSTPDRSDQLPVSDAIQKQTVHTESAAGTITQDPTKPEITKIITNTDKPTAPIATVQPVTPVIAQRSSTEPANDSMGVAIDTSTADSNTATTNGVTARVTPQTTIRETPVNTVAMNSMSDNSIPTESPPEEPAPTQMSPMVSNRSTAAITPSRSPTESSDSRYSAALSMLSQGRTNEAMDLLNEALQIAANDISSRELLSRLLISGQQYQQAEQMLIKGLELTPGQPLLTRLFARTKIDQGQDRLAIAILDQADSNYTLDAESKALLAGLYQRTGRYQDSASYYQRALAIQPDQGKWWLGLGIALEAQSDWAASSHAYQRAISSTQLEPRLRHYAQQRLQSSHEHQPAIH